MTPARGVLVLHPVFVDGGDRSLCSAHCPSRLDTEEDGWICGAFGDQLEMAKDDDPEGATLRSEDCLNAEARAAEGHPG